MSFRYALNDKWSASLQPNVRFDIMSFIATSGTGVYSRDYDIEMVSYSLQLGIVRKLGQ